MCINIDKMKKNEAENETEKQTTVVKVKPALVKRLPQSVICASGDICGPNPCQRTIQSNLTHFQVLKQSTQH